MVIGRFTLAICFAFFAPTSDDFDWLLCSFFAENLRSICNYIIIIMLVWG